MPGFLFAFEGASCLREVSLEVVPEVVQRGKEAILRCHYDLEKAPLYSLKWYRGRHEFYRFSPSEDPATKIFNISGIYVDPANSNKSQVTLRNVDYGLSGTFSCEVTADAPTFSTASVSKNLTVVSLPDRRPLIVSERERYDPGDTLRANCSLPPSKPPVHLSFTLNNMPPPAAPNEILITAIRVKMLSSKFCRAEDVAGVLATGDALPVIPGDAVARGKPKFVVDFDRGGIPLGGHDPGPPLPATLCFNTPRILLLFYLSCLPVPRAVR
ncbi:hypothetical protein X777_08629 [Ooceraea biroi]|uniref:Ig-like domain-containing protein n=1 Tax=Ooceraea biroi TaxID=2015173 RepID=A0A026X3H7_OOCBI|nr:hypothetical protein X777_08629 [Ooceraea biroi]